MTPLAALVGIALGAVVLYRLARGGEPREFEGIIAYIIIIGILAPFIPRALPSPWPVISDYQVKSMGVTITALALEVANAIITALTGGSIPLLGIIANILPSINEGIWLILGIYTVGYLAWLWVVPAIVIGAVMALRDSDISFAFAYMFIALAVIAGVLAPVITIIHAISFTVPQVPYYTAFLSEPNNTLVITDQGFGITPTVLMTQAPPKVEGVVWLWLRFNYIIVNESSYYYNLARIVVIKLEPQVISITCPTGACGAYMIMSGKPLGIRAYPNATVVITTNESLTLWLWGGGFSTNCTASSSPSHLIPVINDISNYTYWLAKMPNASLPAPSPTGYRQVVINVAVPTARVGNETKALACTVALYGVPTNPWHGSTPNGFTWYEYQLIAEADSLASLGTGKWLARLLITVGLLGAIGTVGVITWDYWLVLVRRLVGW